jgi:endonuclease YncB( thermonuclease family)
MAGETGFMTLRRISWLAAGALALGNAQAGEITSYALVGDDGTLRVANHTIRLFGVHIPTVDSTCNTFVRPISCKPRAVLQLEARIGSSFVRCDTVWRAPDGTLTARCSVDGEDLAGWMLQYGWAFALPDAPFEYVALERIARSRGLGFWGMPVDDIRRR